MIRVSTNKRSREATMKTTIIRTILAICTLVTLAVLISFTNKAARIQTAAISQQQTVPVLPGAAYSGLVNGLFAAGGR
jgi:uncharacterized membrane protein